MLIQFVGVKIVGNIVIDFSEVDLDEFESKMDGKGERVWRLPVSVFIKLGDRQGTLTFRTVISGEQCGKTSMDFSGH